MEFLQTIPVGGWAAIVTALLTLVQITPIKINPWSWIATQIGRAINKEVMEKQDAFQKETQEYRKNNDRNIKEIRDTMNRNKIEEARNRILRFGDEIKSKQIRHSEEYYNQILDDITRYEQYCNEHPDFQNERTVSTKKIIKEAYENHLRNNDFL